MYSGGARSSYRQECCDDFTKLGLCDWFTNELTDWRRRRRRKEITYETLGYHLVQKRSLGRKQIITKISMYVITSSHLVYIKDILSNSGRRAVHIRLHRHLGWILLQGVGPEVVQQTQLVEMVADMFGSGHEKCAVTSLA